MEIIIETLVGLFLPFVIDAMNKGVTNSRVKYLVSVFLCLGLGILLNLEKATVGDVLGSGALIFTSAQTMYKLYWKNSKVRKVFQ